MIILDVWYMDRRLGLNWGNLASSLCLATKLAGWVWVKSLFLSVCLTGILIMGFFWSCFEDKVATNKTPYPMNLQVMEMKTVDSL